MIAGVQAKMRSLWQQTIHRLVGATRLPSVVVEETELVLGPNTPSARSNVSGEAKRMPSASETDQRLSALKFRSLSASNDQGRATEMAPSMDALAEQMLSLVEIVSAQEGDIKLLKEQCRRLEEHDQAIAVAFSTFFHVLSASRVAKLSEIASILKHITEIAEQEGRPPEAIKFLQDLAAMLPPDQS